MKIPYLLISLLLVSITFAEEPATIPDYADLLESFDAMPAKPAQPEHETRQIDIEVQFVHVPVDTPNTVEALKNARGKNAPAPLKVRTLNRHTATIEVVKEVIYPTGFDIISSNTNDPNVAVRFAVRPTAFETRNTGYTMEATPQLVEQGKAISLDVFADHTEQTGEIDYGFDYTDEKGNRAHIPMVQPIFTCFSSTTTVLITNSETVAVGGGVNPDGKTKTCLLIQASTVPEEKKTKKKEAL